MPKATGREPWAVFPCPAMFSDSENSKFRPGLSGFFEVLFVAEE